MAVFKSEAIVLKQFDLGEADKIITFYTKERGKVRAVAANVRKPNNRFSGLVLPFSYTNITVYQGKSLDRINQVKIIYSFSVLREDLNKMAHASYLAEFIEKVGMEENPNPDLFSLLLSSFHKLMKASEDILDNMLLIFKFRIMSICGFRPQFKKCSFCGCQVQLNPENIFDIASGGVVCYKCRDKTTKPHSDKKNYLYFSGESFRIVNIIFDSGLTIPKNLKISRSAYKQLENIIDSFIKYHLDLYLKSEKFLYMIRDFG